MGSATTDRRMGLAGNTAYKTPAAALAPANIVLSGEQTIGGVAVKSVNAAGIPDRVLCVGQTDATANGLWDVSTGSWTRSIDADGNYDWAQGTQVLITQGSYAFQIWNLTTANPITVGSTALTFSQSITAGNMAAIAAPSGSSLMGFVQTGTGSVPRTMQSKARDVVSITDFFANGVSGVAVDPSGVVDSTLGIQAAINAVAPALPGNPWDLHATAGALVVSPTGKFKVSGPISIPSWVNFRGAGKSATMLVAAAAGTTVLAMGAAFIGSIAGTTLTITSVIAGTLSVGAAITGSGVTALTSITALGTGTGGVGTYTVNNAQAVGSVTIMVPAYHCSASGLSINGSSLNISGLSIYASFWMTNDVEATFCNYHGWYMYSSYTGKAYNSYSFYNASAGGGYAGITADGPSYGLGANDILFSGGSIGNCYDGFRINQSNGFVVHGVSIQSSSRIGVNLSGQASGVTFRDCYFEANVMTVNGGFASIYGNLSYFTLADCYFTGTGTYESKFIAGSGFDSVRIVNNSFSNVTPTSYIGLVNEAAGSCVFQRVLIMGNSSPNDSIPLFSPALKVFVDAALFAVDTATLNRIDHLTQYAHQVSGIKSYVVTLTPSTSGTITLDPAANTATYTKIDKLVHVQGRILVSSVAAPVGTNIKLSLPLPIATLPQASGKIGGVIVDTSTNLRPFTGDETNSYVNVFLTVAAVAGGMYYSFSFSYLTT